MVRGSDLIPGLTVRLILSGQCYQTVLHERLLKLSPLDGENRKPFFMFRFGVNPLFEIIEDHSAVSEESSPEP